MSNCLMCGAWSSDDHADDCPNKPLTPSESKPSEAGAGEATVSGPTHGSPERERGDHAGPESQQPCSPAEPGGESEVKPAIVPVRVHLFGKGITIQFEIHPTRINEVIDFLFTRTIAGEASAEANASHEAERRSVADER